MPGNFHQTIVVGTVGRDPEMRYLQDGTPVTSFSIAVNEYWTDRQSNERREKTTWYSANCWGKLAEVTNNYVKKGTNIMLVGTVSARAYTGNDGQPRASLDLRVQNFQLLGSRGDGGSGDSSSGGHYDEGYNPPPQDLDDIPF